MSMNGGGRGRALSTPPLNLHLDAVEIELQRQTLYTEQLDVLYLIFCALRWEPKKVPIFVTLSTAPQTWIAIIIIIIIIINYYYYYSSFCRVN